MALLLFLNERTYEKAPYGTDLSAALHRFVAILVLIRNLRNDAALITEPGFDHRELSSGVSLRSWSYQSSNRDAGRLIRAVRNRAPIINLDTQIDFIEAVEFHHNGMPSLMLGQANLHDGIGLGFDFDPYWNVAEVVVERTELRENDDGDVSLETRDVTVRHIALADHVNIHREWLVQAGHEHISSGYELWSQKDDLYPHLRFLPRVEDDLKGLRSEWLHPLLELLAKLSLAADEATDGRLPNWRTKVTPEYEHRKRLCYFHDPAVNSDVVFDLHARMTPGAGRVHLRWDASRRKVVIAYVGVKLGT